LNGPDSEEDEEDEEGEGAKEKDKKEQEVAMCIDGWYAPLGSVISRAVLKKVIDFYLFCAKRMVLWECRRAAQGMKSMIGTAGTRGAAAAGAVSSNGISSSCSSAGAGPTGCGGESSGGIDLMKQANSDSVLKTYHFTNVFREQDRGTQYWRKELLRHKHLFDTKHQRDARDARGHEERYIALVRATLCASIVYRLLNKIETFEHEEWGKGVPLESQLNEFKSAIKRLRKKSETNKYKLFTGAHQVCGPDRYLTTLDALVSRPGPSSSYHDNERSMDLLGCLVQDIVKVNDDPKAICALLCKHVPQVSKFMSWQVVCDLMEARLLLYSESVPATDRDWVELGPGAKNGLALIFGKRSRTAEEQLRHSRYLVNHQVEAMQRINYRNGSKSSQHEGGATMDRQSVSTDFSAGKSTDNSTEHSVLSSSSLSSSLSSSSSSSSSTSGASSGGSGSADSYPYPRFRSQPMTLKAVEHALCEYSKYDRLRTGSGSLRRYNTRNNYRPFKTADETCSICNRSVTLPARCSAPTSRPAFYYSCCMCRASYHPECHDAATEGISEGIALSDSASASASASASGLEEGACDQARVGPCASDWTCARCHAFEEENARLTAYASASMHCSIKLE